MPPRVSDLSSLLRDDFDDDEQDPDFELDGVEGAWEDEEEDDDEDIEYFDAEDMEVDEEEDQDEEEEDDEYDDEEMGELIGEEGARLIIQALRNQGSGQAADSFIARILGNSFTTGGRAGGIQIISGGAAGARARREPSRQRNAPPPVTTPLKEGLELRYGGEFGDVGDLSHQHQHHGCTKQLNQMIWDRERSFGVGINKFRKADYGAYALPNTSGTTVAHLSSRPYCGQYSHSSDFFYTATQDFTISLYNTTAPVKVARGTMTPAEERMALRGAGQSRRRMNFYTYDDSPMRPEESSLERIKAVQGIQGGWTVTDCDLSHDDEWMIYSSMSQYVHMFKTSGADEEQLSLDFSMDDNNSYGSRRRGGYSRGSDVSRIWAVRFSADGKEIVAGASGGYSEDDGMIIIYDLDREEPVENIPAHNNDVNGIAFADERSTNIVISASDDGYLKVWDRRSLSSNKPSGILSGHTEGITYVSPKGDGRYAISNGKDQTLKLWDLRSMRENSVVEACGDAAARYGVQTFDYRNSRYEGRGAYRQHPDDCSVMTYRGHSVLRTLIRCHFSPVATTGQQYIYSGSADGRIHIWSLDGLPVQVLDRSQSLPLHSRENPLVYNDPSSPDPSSPMAAAGRRGGGDWNQCVRDVSWHPERPELMSTCWDSGSAGSIAKHEWKSWSKNISLEDFVSRQSEECVDFAF